MTPSEVANQLETWAAELRTLEKTAPAKAAELRKKLEHFRQENRDLLTLWGWFIGR